LHFIVSKTNENFIENYWKISENNLLLNEYQIYALQMTLKLVSKIKSIIFISIQTQSIKIYLCNKKWIFNTEKNNSYFIINSIFIHLVLFCTIFYIFVYKFNIYIILYLFVRVLKSKLNFKLNFIFGFKT